MFFFFNISHYIAHAHEANFSFFFEAERRVSCASPSIFCIDKEITFFLLQHSVLLLYFANTKDAMLQQKKSCASILLQAQIFLLYFCKRIYRRQSLPFWHKVLSFNIGSSNLIIPMFANFAALTSCLQARPQEKTKR